MRHNNIEMFTLSLFFKNRNQTHMFSVLMLYLKSFQPASQLRKFLFYGRMSPPYYPPIFERSSNTCCRHPRKVKKMHSISHPHCCPGSGVKCQRTSPDILHCQWAPSGSSSLGLNVKANLASNMCHVSFLMLRFGGSDASFLIAAPSFNPFKDK